MPLLFWDASALTKRYAPEIGSATVHALFAGHEPYRMATTAWSYAETYSVLLRGLNRGTLNQEVFAAATLLLEAEVVMGTSFGFLAIHEPTVFACLPLMSRHNLNATDAALLTMLLEYTVAAPADGPLVVVAADQRLLRAAAAEGLRTLNPETLLAADVPPFLAGL